MEHVKQAASSLPLPTPQAISQSNNCGACGGCGWVTDCDRDGVRRCHCLTRRIGDQQINSLPVRFRDSTFANYVPIDSRQEFALAKVQESVGRGLFLWGAYGRGKTHLASAQYRALVEGGQSCLFRSMAELLSELRAAEVHNETSLVLQRVRYADSFHLFVDDVDKFKVTDFKREVLHDLIDTIYKRKLGLTITSNFNLTGLIELERLDRAIIRRIDEMCTAIEV